VSVGCGNRCSLRRNPYDGHTVDSQLEQVGILTGHTPKIALADRRDYWKTTDSPPRTGSRAQMATRFTPCCAALGTI